MPGEVKRGGFSRRRGAAGATVEPPSTEGAAASRTRDAGTATAPAAKTALPGAVVDQRDEVCSGGRTELPAGQLSDRLPRASVGSSGALRLQIEERLEVAPGPKGLPPPEVVRLLLTYGVGERLGRPRERILETVAELQQSFSAPDIAAAVLDPQRWSGIRAQLFALEGLLRLYRREYGDPIRSQLAVVKQAEDALGWLDHAHELHRLSVVHGFPAEVQAHLAAELTRARDAVSALVAERWTPPPGEAQVPALGQLIDTLQGIDWQGYKDDRKTLRKALRRAFEKADGHSYDMHTLQGDEGLHELRRRARWLGIQAPALRGLIVLDDQRHPIPEHAGLLDQPVAQSKYARLPIPTREKKPIRFARSLYLANTELIDKLGKLKDQGESIEDLGRAWYEALLAPGLSARERADPDRLQTLLHQGEQRAAELLGATRTLTQIGAEGDALLARMHALGHFEAMAAEFD